MDWLLVSAFLSGVVAAESVHLAIGIVRWRRALQRARRFNVIETNTIEGGSRHMRNALGITLLV